MRYRLTRAAQSDIISILAWTDEQFGTQARQRYQALIIPAIRDAASRPDDIGHIPRPQLGDKVFTWHLSQSSAHSPGGRVRRPRHFLICRGDGNTLVIGRVLHDAMDLRRHVDPQQPWDDLHRRRPRWLTGTGSLTWRAVQSLAMECMSGTPGIPIGNLRVPRAGLRTSGARLSCSVHRFRRGVA